MKKTIKILGAIMALMMIFTMLSCETTGQPAVESIEITKLPDENSFVVNNEYYIFDIVGKMEIKVNYSDGTSTLYNYADNWEFFENELKFTGKCIDENGYFTPELGENAITITCGGKTTDLIINGLKVQNIEITQPPEKTTFIVNNKYYVYDYLNGIEVKVNYSDGTNRLYTYENDTELFETEFEISGKSLDENGYFTPESGDNVITLTYYGKSADLTVKGGEVGSIEVTKAPDTKFIANYQFFIYDFIDGMEIRVNYTDNFSEIYNFDEDVNLFYDLQFSGKCIDSYGENIVPALGENVITVAYGDKTAEFKITGLEVEGIEITKNPNKTSFIVNNEYYIDDYFDGMEVSVSYSDKTNRLYTSENDLHFLYDELKLSGESLDAEGSIFTPVSGENPITVSCGGKTTELILNGLEVESIKIITSEAQNEFRADNKYSINQCLEGMKAEVSYSNGTTEKYSYEDDLNFFEHELKYSGDCVDEYGVSFTPVSGNNVITVICGEKTAEFTITGT